jgi:hypothetical protein
MFTAKGYFILADGTKSTDYESGSAHKKKKAKSSPSPVAGKKR